MSGMILGLSLLGLAVGVALLAGTVWGVARVDRGDATRRDLLDTARRVRLRASSWTYRLAEPIIDPWARSLEVEPTRRLVKVASELNVVLDSDGWTPSEWMAARKVEAIVFGLGLGVPVGLLAAPQFGPGLLPVAVVLIGFMVLRWGYTQLENRARQARALIGAALPSSIDMIVLMFQAGAPGLREAVQILVHRTPETIWTGHLRRLIRDIDSNLPVAMALDHLAARLGMEDVDSLAFAFKQAEHLGTPIVPTLLTQSRQINDRRAQAIERAAEQSKVYLVAPGMMSLAACLITMLAPLLISVAKQLTTVF